MGSQWEIEATDDQRRLPGIELQIEAFWEPWQKSLTIFAKSSFLDDWQGPENAS